MDTESLEQKILADIEKAGFRSEMEVLAKLRSSGLKATGLASYFDLDAEISREYDAEAYLTSIAKNDKEILFNFFYSLCIEVKKSQSPWVIFAEEPIHEFYLSEALNSPCFFAGIEDNVPRSHSPEWECIRNYKGGKGDRLLFPPLPSPHFSK